MKLAIADLSSSVCERKEKEKKRRMGKLVIQGN